LQLDGLPDVDTRLIQSLIVNYYGYRPLGKWKATNFGDTEFGFLYQLKKWKEAGVLLSMGAVAPTGKVDDPDILQDIAFGDGQWDTFFEFGGGLNLPKNIIGNWSVDAWTRLTYQFPYKANIRQPESRTFPLTTRKSISKIKLGNKAQTNLQLSFHFSDQLMTSFVYMLDYKESDKYNGPYAISDYILQIDTERNSQTAKVNFNFSTVALFQQKKFIAPLNFNLSAQTIFTGKNVPYYKRLDFEIALYF
jgi:hypothetical protein